ncbi:hypothetical protein [Corynebacterium ulcerans]|uniref:hypothetical protein n=1 Tax=Corynebacterium ulcerans TaxID=65058 RepID=UPI000DFFC211|nr:hypothetical protein [Corynebacterium ulcerans]STC79606.1 phage tail fiber protein [Corynebacterium ulcerans]
MPKLKGSLKNITDKPSTIREVLLRATHTRTNGKTITTSEPVRVKVSESGDFTETLAPGAAVLVLVGADFMARESIPLLVAEGMTTIAEAMEAAKDFTPEVADKLAELAAETQKNLAEAHEVRAEADSAAQKMREAAQALKDSVDGSIAEATAGIKKSGSELLASMQALQSNAASSESEAKESAQGAEASRSAALASASSASSSAGEAAESLAGLRVKIEEWKPHGEQLTQWQPQFEWLKENAASGFTKIAELMQDAAAGVRGELSGLVEQAKTAQTTAGQHALKAQAAANNAESLTNRVVDAAINRLVGGASSAYDTLKELEDKLTSQDSVAAAIMRQLAEKASQADVSELAQKITNLGIDGVRGLSAALAGKAPVSHRHSTPEINGLDDLISNIRGEMLTKATSEWVSSEFSSIKGQLNQKIESRNLGPLLSQTSEFSGLSTQVSQVSRDMPKIEHVSSLPSYPDNEKIYMVWE